MSEELKPCPSYGTKYVIWHNANEACRSIWWLQESPYLLKGENDES